MRVPRNQVWVLQRSHKKILSILEKWDKPYPPMTRDFAEIMQGSYSTVRYNLYELDKRGYIEIIRDAHGHIRAVKLLATV